MSSRRKRRNRYEVNTQFASFGDIAIQLVIFFILASHFAKEPSADLQLAKSEELKTLDTPKVLVVIDDRNRIYLNTEEVANAKAVENFLTSLFEQQEAENPEPNRPTGDGGDEGTDAAEPGLNDRVVHFKCHRGAQKYVYEPVIDAIAKAGALIAVVGEEGDPLTPIIAGQ